MKIKLLDNPGKPDDLIRRGTAIAIAMEKEASFPNSLWYVPPAVVDAVPVVRCKDCKYHTAYRCPNDNLHWTHNCTLGNGTDGDDYYCADGERREANDGEA